MRLSCAAFVLACLLLAPPVHAQGTAPALDGDPVPDSAATEVLVLGTPHLSRVADRLEARMLDSLLTRLHAFAPNAIAVEQMSGRQAAAMERWDGAYDRVVEAFAGPFLFHGHAVRNASGLPWSHAQSTADSLLAHAAADALAPSERLRLVRHLVGAYRLPTAVLQWARLPAAVRDTQRVLPDTTASYLTHRRTAANEVYSIGARLALQQGHDRLYPIDDHTSKDRLLDILERFRSAMPDSLRQAARTHPAMQRQDSLMTAGLESENLLPMYRYTNQLQKAEADVDAQWKTMLRTDLPDDVQRVRVALWETRNLAIAGHIRRVTANVPGGRVLVLIGSSHKPYLDAYLARMMDVHLVDPEEVLGI